MIKTRKFMGISMARRSRRRWLVVGLWALMLAFAGYFPSLLQFGLTSFGMPAQWAFFAALLLIGLLGGQGRKGLVGDFHGHTPEDGQPDYSFMTPEDIAARKQAQKENRLDERDVRLRNSVHYTAYAVVSWIAILVVFAVETDRIAEFAEMRESLLLLFFLIVQGLPQSILLWTEPDMDSDSTDSAPLSVTDPS